MTLVLILAIAAVLSGAPSSASATDAGGIPRLAANPTTTPVAETTPAGPTLMPFGVAIGGFAGLAGLALLAWFVLLPRRRRRVESGQSDSRPASPAGRTAAEEEVAAALHRRTLRRGRMRLEEDPIIASMGVASRARAKPGVSRAQRSARRSPPT
jgi:hypothetical protein